MYTHKQLWTWQSLVHLTPLHTHTQNLSYGSVNFSFSSFSQSGVRLVRGIVKDVKAQKLILTDGTEVPYGLLVWSTGVGPSPLVNSLELPKSPGGRLVT